VSGQHLKSSKSLFFTTIQRALKVLPYQKASLQVLNAMGGYRMDCPDEGAALLDAQNRKTSKTRARIGYAIRQATPRRCKALYNRNMQQPEKKRRLAAGSSTTEPIGVEELVKRAKFVVVERQDGVNFRGLGQKSDCLG
jgi:hypothetical protein